MALALHDVELPDGERSVHTLRIGSGEPRGEVSTLVEHSALEHSGRQDALEHSALEHSGRQDDAPGVRVVIDADLGAVAITVDQLFTRTARGLLAQSYLAETWNDGRLVTREEGHFPGRSHVLLGGEIGAFPRGLTPLAAVMTTWRGLDFRQGLTGQVPVWLAFSLSWPVDVRVERRERLRVPAGTVDAWRVVVRPSLSDLGPLGVVLEQAAGAFIPDAVLHFAVDDPHPLIRAEAPTGPFPWSPRAVLELASIELPA